MNSPFPYMAQPISINSLTLSNRFVMAPMSVRYAAPNGEVTERLIAYYEARARGGVGLVLVETACVELSGKNGPNGLGIYSETHLSGLGKLARRVHACGAKVGIQLLHRGRSASEAVTGMPVRLVSYVPGLCPETGIVLDESEIAAIVQSYAQAAVRARKAGFDAVEIHGAHGYLINQFLSPLTNQRTDAYGGSPEKRLRFALDVITAVRTAVGADYPVLFRMDALEGREGGLTVQDAAAMAPRLVEAGVDALHVSAGIAETRLDVPLAHVRQGWNADNAALIRQAVKAAVPVISVGRYADPALAEAVVSQGKADMIALGRPLLADPEYVNKAFAGRSVEIMACIACNEGCVGRTGRNLDARCALNPRTGRECLPLPAGAVSPLTVWIAGGGPAGLQAAETAAEAGHRVTLFEQSAALGGLLRLACKPPHKSEIAGIAACYGARLKRLGVQIVLNTPLTCDAVLEGKPDVLFVATGSVPIFPAFCRGNARVVRAEQVLSGQTSPQGTVLVLGGGMIGCETAEYLAERGAQVTILEMRSEIAADMLPPARDVLLARLQALSVRLLTDSKVLRIEEDGRVLVEGRYGCEQTLAASDTLVAALGYRPEQTLGAALFQHNIPFTELGDCRHVGKIMDAIHQAHETVLRCLAAVR